MLNIVVRWDSEPIPKLWNHQIENDLFWKAHQLITDIFADVTAQS